MKCKQCRIDGLSSSLFHKGSKSTTMGTSQFYDEVGEYHVHDPNLTTTTWRCSMGHVTVEKSLHKCPVCGA